MQVGDDTTVVKMGGNLPGVPAPQSYQASVPSQLGATLKRQFIQKRRMPCSCCLEIFLPIIFILGLVFAAKASDIIDNPGRNYVKGPDNYSDPIMMGARQLCYNTSATASIPAGVRAMVRPCGVDPTLLCDDLTTSKWDIPVAGLCAPRALAIQIITGNASRFREPRIIPDLDTMIMYHWAFRISGSTLKQPGFSQPSVQLASYNSGLLYWLPLTESKTTSIVNYFNTTSTLYRYIHASRVFPTYADATNYLGSVEGEGTGWGVVRVGEVTSLKFDVTLSFNLSSIPWTNRVRSRFDGGLGMEEYEYYYWSGFLTLQETLNKYYTTNILGTSASVFNNRASVAVPMPTAAYKDSVFLTLAGRLTPLVLVLSFLYSVSQLCKRLVEEKENRLREGMLIMGLGKGTFYAGWLITYTLQALLTSLVVTIVLKRGMLTGSDPTIIFLVYFLFALSSITLGSLFSTLFSKSRISGIVAPLLYFAMSIPTFSLSQDAPAGTLRALSILSPSAFSVATTLLFQYELGDGMGWNSVASSLDKVNMATALIFLAFDCVLYLLLTLYLDAVLPSEWGTRAHPLFFLPCFGRQKSKDTVKAALPELQDRNSALREMNADEARRQLNQPGNCSIEDYPRPIEESTVHIDNLLREFGEGDAKKTAVDHLQLRLFPNHITALLGHNGAGKTTTINMLTGMLGMTGGDCFIYGTSVKGDLTKARGEVGFCPQHNILWPGLTCMEHLEYFAALKGVPAKDRRAQAHTFLNHVDLADKADVFSANLSGGQKRKLSVAIAFIGGSRLILLDEPTAGMDVAARRHTWELLKNMSSGRTIVLTTHFMDEADLLGHRVAIMSKGRLHSYGSPMFLKSKLGTGYALRVSCDKAIPNPAPLTQMISRFIPSAHMKECKGQEAVFHLPISSAEQFPAALTELETTGRTQLGVVGTSMSVSTLEDVFLQIAEEEDHPDQKIKKDEEQRPDAIEIDPKLKAALDSCFGPNAPSRDQCTPSFGTQLKALLGKRFANSRRDRRTICLQIFTPLVCILLAMLLTMTGPPKTPPLELDLTMYGTKEKQMISMTGCGSEAQYFNTEFEKDIITPDRNRLNFSDHLLRTAKTHGQAERFVSIVCNQPVGGFGAQQTTFFTNASARHSLVQVVNEYYQAVGRSTVANPAVTMTLTSDPLPRSVREEAALDGFLSLIVGFFILIPFTFIPSTFVSFIVKERECKAKHQQLVSGLSITAYWVSNFLFDLLSFLFTEFMAIAIFAAFGRDEYIGDGTVFSCLFVLFTLYGISSIANAYAFSFAFDTHGTAQNLIMLLNFIFGFVLVITSYILGIIDSTKDANKVLVFFFRLIPSYCLGEGILAMAAAKIQVGGPPVDVWDLDETGWAMIYMGINFILFTTITAILDSPGRAKRRQQLFHDKNKIPPPIDSEDPDVLQERTIVEGGTRPGDVVTVKHLRKEYPNGKVAVKNLSFGVVKGEVFGFLGTNGAGKTTTMSILTGEHMPTNGAATIGSYDVVEEAAAARSLIGYCPQFDAVLDLLTVADHVNLYASIRGIPSAKKTEVVEGLILACGLDKYRNIPSKSLSGGNKRRLSVAMALMGSPELIILDEPSAGMDPVARREMWEVIVHVARHSSVILTTHHLEEIEVLAHRVGIMVDGEMKCLGNLGHLKRKFGSGFEVNVRVDGVNEASLNEGTAAVKIFMTNQFRHSTLVEERQGKLTYTMPHRGTSLAGVFGTLLEAKRSPRMAIADFTVQQTSLEQVFLRISESNESNDANDGANPSSPAPDSKNARASAAHLSFLDSADPGHIAVKRGQAPNAATVHVDPLAQPLVVPEEERTPLLGAQHQGRSSIHIRKPVFDDNDSFADSQL